MLRSFSCVFATLTLSNHMDCSPPGSSVHGILQQEYWSGLPFPPPGDLPDLGIQPRSPSLQADSFLSEPPGTRERHSQIHQADLTAPSVSHCCLSGLFSPTTRAEAPASSAQPAGFPRALPKSRRLPGSFPLILSPAHPQRSALPLLRAGPCISASCHPSLMW